MGSPLSICLVSSELTPFAKTGGLGDVVASVARHLHLAGHDVRTFLPLYAQIDRQSVPFVPVSFLRDVPIRMGSRTYSFTAYSAPLPGTGLPLYFLHCPVLYDRPGIYTDDADEAVRFAFLSRAALECCQRMGWAPDVCHANDWHTALLPLYLRTVYGWDQLFSRTRTLLTLHNIGYQGIFRSSLLGDLGLAEAASFLYQDDLAQGRINFLKTGIVYATALSTVSKTHAEELQTDRYGMGLQAMLRARADHLFGIVNGIDVDVWDPGRDQLLPYNYSADDLTGKRLDKRYLLEGMGLSSDGDGALLGIVSRLTAQKGFDLCFDVLPGVLAQRDLRLIVLGTGEDRYRHFFEGLQARFPGRVGFYYGYNEKLAHLVEAGADLFLMPSLYEPCGLNQMYSQRYGTPPIVRQTGGLADTVDSFDPATGEGTGFVFQHFTSEGLEWALHRALDAYAHPDTFLRVIQNGMARDFSWQTQIQRYVELYRALLGGLL